MENVYCSCGNLLLSQHAEPGDKCRYCMDQEDADKPLKSKRRDNTRNQHTTGFYK